MSPSIAIVGGTGPAGFGLALRWAQAGARVVIGSRKPERANRAAQQVMEQVPGAEVEGLPNPEAVRDVPIVVVTVPLAAQIDTLKSIRDNLAPGTVVVDTTVPLEKAVGGRLSQILPLWEGSAAQRARRALGADIQVAAAFHTLSAASLGDLAQPVDSDVLIAGDSPQAREVVSQWVRKITGARPVEIGPLENARYAEHLAALLISLNLRHKVKSGGVRFTGLPNPAEGR